MRISRGLRAVLACGALLCVLVPHIANPASTAASATPTSNNSFLPAVSCVSPSFCEATGFDQANSGFYVPLAEMWDGKSWLRQSPPDPPASGFSDLRAVSCVSATFCEAVGSNQSSAGTSTLAEVWNGTTWAIQPIPNAAGTTFGLLDGVSCVSVTFCEAVGYGGLNEGSLAEVWNGASWAVQSTPNSGSASNQLLGVSCASATFCEAVGGIGGNQATLAEMWDGTAWTMQPGPSLGGTIAGLRGVSCVSGTDCEAIGSASIVSNGPEQPLAEQWNGTSWTVQPSPNGDYPMGVSCASATFCEAVAIDGGPAEKWDGTSWTLQPVANIPGAASATLDGVSCVSSVDCEAVGYGNKKQANNQHAITEVWNGTSWTAQ